MNDPLIAAHEEISLFFNLKNINLGYFQEPNNNNELINYYGFFDKTNQEHFFIMLYSKNKLTIAYESARKRKYYIEEGFDGEFLSDKAPIWRCFDKTDSFLEYIAKHLN
jgi:hypothetical protein